MKTLLKLTAAATAIVAFSGSAALAQYDGDAEATLTVLEDLVVTQVQDLRFGSITTSDEGTIVITTAADEADALSAITPVAGTTGRGEFTVTGPNDAAISVTAPAGIDMTGPGADVPVTFTVSPEGNTDLDATGELQVFVGGTATVPVGGLTAGDYAGTFTLTVNYQ